MLHVYEQMNCDLTNVCGRVLPQTLWKVEATFSLEAIISGPKSVVPLRRIYQ